MGRIHGKADIRISRMHGKAHIRIEVLVAKRAFARWTAEGGRRYVTPLFDPAFSVT
jgi:hypothetical protein